MPNRNFKNIIAGVTIFVFLFAVFSCSKKEQAENEAKNYNKVGTEQAQPKGLKQNTSSLESKASEINEQGLSSEKPNSPPTIKAIRLMPETFKPGDTLYIEAETSDPDGDEITILYKWYKNDELVSTDKYLNLPIKRGDKLKIKIKPFDGKDYGKVITLEREILNLPPVIIDHKNYHIDKDFFTYQVKASDPDGDPLTYSLKSAPSGMTIDQKGLIKWSIPSDFKGKASVTLSVTDGHGGEARYSFDITIGVR